MFKIPTNAMNKVKLNKSPVIIAPADARPQIIAKNLLCFNSLGPTVTSVFPNLCIVASICVSGLLNAINNVNPSNTAKRNKLNGVTYNTISPSGIVPSKSPPSVTKSILITYSLSMSSLISSPIKPTFEATFNNNPHAAMNKLNNQY